MMKVIVGTPPQQANPKFPEENSLARLAGLQPGRETQGLFRRETSDSPAVLMVEDLSWEKTSIDEVLAMATTMSLMGDMSIFRFSGALSGELADEFLDIAKDLVASPHQFIFTEDKLLKRPTDILTKAGVELVVYPATKKEEGFNMFSITSTFAVRDRKKLWLQMHEALRAGAVPEAIAGMLHWKVRDMLAHRSSSEGGLQGERKPSNSTRPAGYSTEELRDISSRLVVLYHDSHRGAGDLALLLERFVLML